jgi:hypothetical protein
VRLRGALARGEAGSERNASTRRGQQDGGLQRPDPPRTWRSPNPRPSATSSRRRQRPAARCDRLQQASNPNRSIARCEGAARRLAVHRQRLQRPSDSIVIEEAGRDSDQLTHRRPGRPVRHVMQREGERNRLQTSVATTSPTDSCQRGPRASARSTTPNEIQLAEEMPGQHQRPGLAAHPHSRRANRTNDPASGCDCPDPFNASFRRRLPQQDAARASLVAIPLDQLTYPAPAAIPSRDYLPISLETG